MVGVGVNAAEFVGEGNEAGFVPEEASGVKEGIGEGELVPSGETELLAEVEN